LNRARGIKDFVVFLSLACYWGSRGGVAGPPAQEFPDFPDLPDFPGFPESPDFPEFPEFPDSPDFPGQSRATTRGKSAALAIRTQP